MAEIGINHQGNLGIATQMIDRAKECGADVAKFQVYDPEKLLDPNDYTPRDWAAIKKTKLDFDEVHFLFSYCQIEGIEFMASAFDKERLEWLEKVGVKRHKIASRTVDDLDYCKAVLKTGKTVFVSDGKALGKFFGAPNVKWLYCISKYPTALEEISWDEGIFWKNAYYGFSDHTQSLTAAKTAIVLGAKLIEKHFTLDKSLAGPDHCCSMEPYELRELCKFRDEFDIMDWRK